MKPSTKRLIESLRARASLVAAGFEQWSFGGESHNRLAIAKYERRDTHKYRREANLYSLWTRKDSCRIRGINPNQGKTKHETII